jgi:hypothetical protein
MVPGGGASPPARGSLLASALHYGQARAYCRLSSAWELAEDPLPRLALLLVRQQALLVYRILWDIHPRARTAQIVLARAPVIVTAEVGIAVASSSKVVTQPSGLWLGVTLNPGSPA